MRSKDDLKAIVAGLTAQECDRIFDLSFLDNSGVTPTKRKRLQAMLVANDKRARPGWLDFFIHASEAFGSARGGDFSAWAADDLDFSGIIGDGVDDFAESSSDLLDEYVQYLHDLGPRFAKFPIALLPDLNRDKVGEDGKVVYKLPANFDWPSQRDVVALVGKEDGGSDGGSHASSEERLEAMSQELALYKDQLRDMPDTVKETLRTSISENTFGVSGDNSMAVLRKTMAWKLEPDEFFLFSHFSKPDGSRDAICDSGNPLERSILESLFFDNEMSHVMAKQVERRTLMQEEFFLSARVLPDEKLTVLGGKDSKAWREYEMYRIRQQTQIKNSQPTFKIVNHVSRAMGSIVRLKARHDEGVIDFDVGTLDALALVQDQLKQALYGASDSLHLVAMDVSELERKRDDVYVQSSSGNSQLKVPHAQC